MTKSTGVGRGAGGGRPPKYDEARMLPIVRAMAKLGATDVELAQALRISISTIDLWARTHPKFLKALKPPKRVADDRVERSLYRRALGYQTATLDLPPDTTACIFWLKNRRREAWRDFRATELSTPPGRPLEIAPGAPGEPELIGAYYKRLAAAQAAAALGGAAHSDPAPDPGVGEGGPESEGPLGGEETDQG